MEILQLRYFCDAAKTQNFSKTAKKFGVPPSNISQCIKRLEKELGTNLFARKSNSIVLNDTGQDFYEKTKKALCLLDEATDEIKGMGHHREISICIAANRRLVMLAVEKIRKNFSDTNIAICHKYEEDGCYDIVVSDDLFECKGMEPMVIFSEDIALAVKKDNPLAEKETIEIEDLKKENFISMNNENSLYRVTKRFCKENSLEPNIVIQIDDPYYMRKCVELGLGVAFVPTVSWKEMFSEEVILRKIEGFRRNICVFSSGYNELSRTIKRLVDELVRVCEDEKNS